MNKNLNFILASSSPRRRDLLKQIGISPLILSPSIDENILPNEPVESFLRRVTLAKGQAVFQEDFFHSPIISADTIVLCNNLLIGKPSNKTDADNFLQALSNNTHEVLTGVGILFQGKSYYDYARTYVTFSEISRSELDFYLDNEDYLDKAGAYAIQGKASVFIKHINGCFFNVMGFPLNLFYSMLKKIGIEIYNASGGSGPF